MLEYEHLIAQKKRLLINVYFESLTDWACTAKLALFISFYCNDRLPYGIYRTMFRMWFVIHHANCINWVSVFDYEIIIFTNSNGTANQYDCKWHVETILAHLHIHAVQPPIDGYTKTNVYLLMEHTFQNLNFDCIKYVTWCCKSSPCHRFKMIKHKLKPVRTCCSDK